jgi:hypothetical protein
LFASRGVKWCPWCLKKISEDGTMRMKWHHQLNLVVLYVGKHENSFHYNLLSILAINGCYIKIIIKIKIIILILINLILTY